MDQIEHIAIASAIAIAKFRRSITDTRTYRGADIGGDHNLVIAKIKLKLCRLAKPIGAREKYDVSKLRNTEIRKEFV